MNVFAKVKRCRENQRILQACSGGLASMRGLGVGLPFKLARLMYIREHVRMGPARQVLRRQLAPIPMVKYESFPLAPHRV